MAAWKNTLRVKTIFIIYFKMCQLSPASFNLKLDTSNVWNRTTQKDRDGKSYKKENIKYIKKNTKTEMMLRGHRMKFVWQG